MRFVKWAKTVPGQWRLFKSGVENICMRDSLLLFVFKSS